MNDNRFAALLGFLFVAAWIGFGFGQAVLCLVGAVIFYLGAALYRGELDLGAWQDRVSAGQASTRGPGRRPR